MFSQFHKEKSPHQQRSRVLNHQLLIIIFAASAISAPAWGQAIDPLPTDPLPADPPPSAQDPTTDPANQADPATPTDPTNQTDPATPTDPTNQTDPATPTDPTNQTDPVAPTDPTNQTDPVAPTDPTNQADPTTPTDPAPPTGPTTQPTNGAPQTDSNALDDFRGAANAYIAFRTRRQWQLMNVRNRLMRAPRTKPNADGLIAAAGGYSNIADSMPLSALEVTPAAVTSMGEWTLWTIGDYSRLKDIRAALRKRGHAGGFTVGLERSFGQSVAVGTSFSYIHTRLTTNYNGGHSRINGYTITPYVNVTPVEWLNITVTGGYVYNRERLSWMTAGGLTSGKRHSNGYSLAIVAETSRWLDSLLLTARTGIVASKDSWKPFVDSFGIRQPSMKERIVQWTAEAGAALWLDPVMPYLNVGYTRDLKKAAQETDRDDFTLTGGLSWYGSGTLQNVSADLSGTVVLGRKSQRNYTLSLGFRISF